MYFFIFTYFATAQTDIDKLNSALFQHVYRSTKSQKGTEEES